MSYLVHGGERRRLTIGRSLFDEADELATAVPASCRRTGRCHECIVAVRQGETALSSRTPAERFLPAGFRLACQAVVERDDGDVEISALTRRLRILLPPDQGAHPLDSSIRRAGDLVTRDGDAIDRFRGALLGLALDVGTTSIVFELVDLETGRRAHVAAFENPQRFGGSDVLSRIAYEAARPGELRRVLRRALNRALRDACAALGVDRRTILEAAVVGNPTMRDLFLGLDVQPLGSWPFRSTSETDALGGGRPSSAVTRIAHEIGLLINPRAMVWGVPVVASHVGADTAADLVAVEFAAQRGATMVIDIGTNTEVVVSDGRRVVATSCPAGPAFEGGLVDHGMAGAEGAIESATWRDGRFAWRTIGDAPPEGICGSGLVDVLAESRRVGLLTAIGAMRPDLRGIPIAPEAGIELSRADVSALAQATSANACGQVVLLRRLGLDPGAIDRVFLAGAFASALNVSHGIEIGLLAPVPVERFVRVGNASVRGAAMLLASRTRRRELDALLVRIEHVELEAEPDFFELFVDGCRFEPFGPTA